MNKNDGIRINKFLSQAGICSRRKAEEMIKNKEVTINNQVANIGQKVFENDIVKIKNQIITNKVEKKYYLINKPKKTICSLKDNFDRNIVVNLIENDDYLFPVGRLDYNTTGALLITNDGELANALTHPSSEIIRIYHAKIDQKLKKQELDILNSNSILINEKPSIQKVIPISEKSYEVELKQGSYRHVKKLFESVNKNVVELKRISFAGISCEKMPLGSYRKLTPFEIKQLRRIAKII